MRLPYPAPTSKAASAVMRANRKRDTAPELALRSALHRRGLRYRIDVAIIAGPIRVKPDVVFTRRRVAVFVDGCWWHQCPLHANAPKVNTAYWLPKLRRNVERDRETEEALVGGGWAVVRLWEHEVRASPDRAAATVSAVVMGR